MRIPPQLLGAHLNFYECVLMRFQTWTPTSQNLVRFLRQEMSARDLRHGAYLRGVVQEFRLRTLGLEVPRGPCGDGKEADPGKITPFLKS